MKLIKTIKLHRKLRIKQEVLCEEVCAWSQIINVNRGAMICPSYNEFVSVNKAVRKISLKLPFLYFLLSDLFGGASSLKKESEKIIERNRHRRVFQK